ncbi:hypothetical protein P879_10207 [Paragonimus westermani]|uniref:Uncharacterized protein n=1 Tax=Paragonimus westermani TaxID=34504 RepID=A0A8T0DI18_9TREM|nr:hypothetical protein P879_10207 [Paragonimus westermani]
MLIGCDLSMAHWVLDQGLGRGNDPCAVRGPLGRMLLESSWMNGLTGTPKTSVPHLSGDASLLLQLEGIFNLEFSVPNVLCLMMTAMFLGT